MRPVHNIPSYLHHAASNQAFVRWRGKQVYLGPYNSVESRAAYARFLLSIDASLTVAELCERFLSYARSYYRDSDEPRDFELSLRTVIQRHGSLPADQFTPTLLREVREVMLRNLSRKTLNQRIGRIKRVWRWAAEMELVPGEVAVALGMVKHLATGRSEAVEYEAVSAVSWEVVDATIQQLVEVPRDLVLLLWHTGCRPGEACAMTWAEIDTSVDPWLYRPRRHKTRYRGHDRVVAVGAAAQEVLNRRRGDGWVFPARKGAYSVQALGRAIRRAAERAGVEHWHPNQLRHSFATRVRTMFGLEAAQVALGHQRADVTQVYAERNLSLAIEVARKLG